MRQELLSGFILHTRAYKDSAQLIDFFSREHGLVRGIGYGKQAARFPLFQHLQTYATGKGGLKRFKVFELARPLAPLQAAALYAGMYLNELHVKTLPEGEPFVSSFLAYQQALERLSLLTTQADVAVLKTILRTTELILLTELGFAIDFSCDADGAPIAASEQYVFVGELGFVSAAAYRLHTGLTPVHSIAGEQVLEFGGCDVNAKDNYWLGLVCKARIDHILEYKPLASRSLWQDLYTK